MKKLLSALTFLLFFVAASSQEDSSKLRISLLTCTPGSELYSVFGHSAIRIIDSSAGTDVVYNFGTFDFNDPDFYTKFVLGKLMYYLSQEHFQDFLFAYKYYARGISEQVIDLTMHEKKALQLELFENVREENRYYKYDFLFDNCTTRLRDIIFKSKADHPIEYPQLNIGRKTFRDHLHGYLSRAEMQWTTLGIDLLLGVGADKIMTDGESIFLPDHLATGVRLAILGNKTLMKEELVPLPDAQPSPKKLFFWQTPLFFFSLFSLLCVFPVFFSGLKLKGFQLVMDRILFISSGLLGSLLLFMWFGTDHQSFSNNLNIIWAMPAHLVIGFILPSNNKFLKKYFKVYSLLILFMLVLVSFSPGYINSSLYPLIAALSFRCWILGSDRGV